MAYFRCIVYSALLAGLLTGGIHTGIQYVSTLPYVMQAELYEQSHPQHKVHAAHINAAALQGQVPAGRMTATTVANILMSIGFALLLTTLCSYQKRLNYAHGLAWGLAGFAVFFLAPTWVNAPSLPGAAEEVDLYVRQMWWFAAASVTALGLAAAYYFKQPAWRISGLLLLFAFVCLTPRYAAHYEIAVLSKLAQQFFWASLVSNAAFWLLLGLSVSYFLPRFMRG